jgi:hypothetical protein
VNRDDHVCLRREFRGKHTIYYRAGERIDESTFSRALLDDASSRSDGQTADAIENGIVWFWPAGLAPPATVLLTETLNPNHQRTDLDLIGSAALVEVFSGALAAFLSWVASGHRNRAVERYNQGAGGCAAGTAE